MSTYTVTDTAPRELAGKIASDIRQFSRYYGQPAEGDIRDYLDEIEALLRAGFLSTYTFGYRRGELWVMSYEYAVRQGQLTGGRPGGIEPNLDIAGATYLNFLTYSDSWVDEQTDAERAAFRRKLRVQRRPMNEPSYSGGYWMVDRSYGADGTEITRRQFKR
jgi:hypothetical protein